MLESTVTAATSLKELVVYCRKLHVPELNLILGFIMMSIAQLLVIVVPTVDAKEVTSL